MLIFFDLEDRGMRWGQRLDPFLLNKVVQKLKFSKNGIAELVSNAILFC